MSNVGKNHHRRSIRLKEYDYSQCGYYFVTICTRNRECWFGNIMDDKIILNGLGIIVKQCWDDLIIHFTNMGLDEYVVMPNHFHGIIIIENNALQCRGAPWRAPTLFNFLYNNFAICKLKCFSGIPFGEWVPCSLPPWPGSMTITLSLRASTLCSG